MVQPKAPGQHGTQIAQWLGWADEDYLAARALLLRGFVAQGTMLANTAIEKYLKTGLLARTQSFRNSHVVTQLYQQLSATGPIPPLNNEFLTVLGKAYKLRYPDDLPVGFNISLAATKILAETDATVHALRKGFHFQRGDGKPVVMMLDNLLSNNAPALLEQNAAFGGCSRADVFSKPTACFEIRILTNHEILSAKYEAGPLADDGIFDVEGLKPVGPPGAP
jgi:HEPN domain-containing protein